MADRARVSSCVSFIEYRQDLDLEQPGVQLFRAKLLARRAAAAHARNLNENRSREMITTRMNYSMYIRHGRMYDMQMRTRKIR